MTAPLIRLKLPGFTGRANCAGLGDEMFPGETETSADYAKSLCETCPIRDECLDWALREHERFGVWGGTTPKEREAIRRKTARETSALTARGQHRLALYDAGQTDAQIARAQNVPATTIRLWRNHHKLAANGGAA